MSSNNKTNSTTKASTLAVVAALVLATSSSSCSIGGGRVEAFTVQHRQQNQRQPLSYGLETRLMASTLPSVESQPYFADVKEINSSSSPALVKKTVVTASPASPAVAQKKTASPKKKAAGGHGKDGVFSPVVRLSKTLAGEQQINKLRAKIISMHADVIGNFVETSSSKVGDTVLEVLFAVADKNNDKEICRDELQAAMQTLGFSFLKEKQLDGIFARADKDGNGSIDMDEWKEAAPKTLRVNLTKLAKKNGSDMGLLA